MDARDPNQTQAPTSHDGWTVLATRPEGNGPPRTPEPSRRHEATPGAAEGTAAEMPARTPDGLSGEKAVFGRASIASLVTVLLLAGAWLLASRQAWVKPLFLPSPEAVLQAFRDTATGDLDGQPLWYHLASSLARVAGAFGLAALVGIPVGLLMGVSATVRGALDPIVEFYRPLPPLAYLPLMIIWFGIGETSKILLIFLACFAPVALATRAGVLSASTDQINAARSMGAGRLQVLLHVVLPAALPDILVGLRIGMGVGWTTLVAAEMIAANAGIGQMVLNASNFLRTDVVVMGILIIGVFAGLFEFGIRFLERIFVPWKGRM